MKKIAVILILILVSFFVKVILDDKKSYDSIMASSYDITPWYSNNFFISPYTSYKLINEPVSEYLIKNDGQDDWLVRDVSHNGKSFWTRLDK